MRQTLFCFVLALALCAPLSAQEKLPEIRTGFTIDSVERIYFNFFPAIANFDSASLYPSGDSVSFSVRRYYGGDTIIVISNRAFANLADYLDKFELICDAQHPENMERYAAGFAWHELNKVLTIAGLRVYQPELKLTLRDGREFSGKLFAFDQERLIMSSPDAGYNWRGLTSLSAYSLRDILTVSENLPAAAPWLAVGAGSAAGLAAAFVVNNVAPVGHYSGVNYTIFEIFGLMAGLSIYNSYREVQYASESIRIYDKLLKKYSAGSAVTPPELRTSTIATVPVIENDSFLKESIPTLQKLRFGAGTSISYGAGRIFDSLENAYDHKQGSGEYSLEYFQSSVGADLQYYFTPLFAAGVIARYSQYGVPDYGRFWHSMRSITGGLSFEYIFDRRNPDKLTSSDFAGGIVLNIQKLDVSSEVKLRLWSFDSSIGLWVFDSVMSQKRTLEKILFVPEVYLKKNFFVNRDWSFQLRFAISYVPAIQLENSLETTDYGRRYSSYSLFRRDDSFALELGWSLQYNL